MIESFDDRLTIGGVAIAVDVVVAGAGSAGATL